MEVKKVEAEKLITAIGRKRDWRIFGQDNVLRKITIPSIASIP
jgi:hypothetical protein